MCVHLFSPIADLYNVKHSLKTGFRLCFRKSHTTRECILGVHTDENVQLVFIDTPGMLTRLHISPIQPHSLLLYLWKGYIEDDDHHHYHPAFFSSHF